MNTKHVGVDLHASTTSQIGVRTDDGKLLFEPISVPTQPEPLLTALGAISGQVRVMFEAQTGSKWLKELLEPHVDEVIVCHAADNERNRGNKTDRRDAAELAEALRLGDYTEVYQNEPVRTALRELVSRYLRTIDKLVRAKNQTKAQYRKRGMACPGPAVYEASNRQEFLEKFDQATVRESTLELLEEVDRYEAKRQEAEEEMIEEANSHEGWDPLRSLPGIGKIRAAKLIGLIGTPWRFPGKRQLWRYSCLAVVVHDTRQWYSEGPDQQIQRHHEQITRGLNRDGRPELKEIFKGAAQDAIQHYPEVEEDFRARQAIKSPDKAKLDIARKLASQALTIWKRQEEYDPDKARWKKLSSED